MLWSSIEKVLRNPIKKTLNTIRNDFSKVLEYKVNIQSFGIQGQWFQQSFGYKSIVSLYTSNEQSEMKLNNFIYNSIKTATNLRMNLTKEMKDLFFGNYKTSLKQIQENINNWEDLPYP